MLPYSYHCIARNLYSHFLLVEIGLCLLLDGQEHCFREHDCAHTPHLCISVKDILRASTDESEGINILNVDLENLYFNSCFYIAHLGLGRRNPAKQGKRLPQKTALALPRCPGPGGSRSSPPSGDTVLGLCFPEYGIIYFLPW